MAAAAAGIAHAAPPLEISEGSIQTYGSWSRSAATAPPTVVNASTKGDSSESTVGWAVYGASTKELDTASSSPGPRKRGVQRGWKFTLGSDSRAHVPGRVSPLEEALRNYGDRGSGPIITPQVGLTFDLCEESFDYYNLYSWEIGFGIRYSKSQTYKKNGETYRNMQLFVCVCAGKPDQGARYSIKQRCPAFMRMLHTDDDGWYIKEFSATHNHPLSESCGEKKNWKSHKQIDPHTKELIRNLRANNVSLTKVYCILTSFFGNNNASAITKRALRNLCGKISKENAEDDVKKTVAVFNKMHEQDSGFAHVVDLDKEGKVKTLMWTNGKSRHDYLCFGDAITFDTTYKTNKYNMPFGLFVGVNNHFQSIIFAGVLMRDETIESFEWVFTKFVALMGGKEPKTILTDQCRAMEVALANVLGDVTHRWCKWHVFRTFKQELGPKYTRDFKDELNKVCNHMLTEDEFERGWGELMKKYGLENNVYMQNIYSNRQMWAQAYFRGKFCAKQTSTQRSESANHVLKQFVPPAAPMHLFAEQYHKLLSDLNEKEDRKVHEDKLPLEDPATGWPIEMHAAKFYTKSMLRKFVEHMKQAASYDVVEIIPRQKYKLVHVDTARREQWCRGSYEVEMREDGGYYYCECGLWEHMGMLCCHSIRVMMQLMVREIPKEHLLQRWSRNGSKVVAGNLIEHTLGSSLQVSRTFRNASLTKTASELVDLGDVNIECYDICIKGMTDLMEEIKSKRHKSDGLGYQAQLADAALGSTGNVAGSNISAAVGSQLDVGMLPPDIRRQVGRPTNSRDRPGFEVRKGLTTRIKRCKRCRQPGHNADRCPNRDPALDKPREPRRCSKCKMPGHTKLNCSSLIMVQMPE